MDWSRRRFAASRAPVGDPICPSLEVEVPPLLAGRAAEWSVAALILFIPVTLAVSAQVGSSRLGAAPLIVSIFPVDIGLLAVAVSGLPVLIGRVRRRQVPGPCCFLALLTALTLIATIVHPTPDGFQLSARLGACIIVVLVLSDLGHGLLRGPVLWALVAVGLEQSILATGQVLAGQALGLTLLGFGESQSYPLIPFGGLPSARGTFFHPYVLAGFAVIVSTIVFARTVLLHQQRRLMYAATCAIAVPIGLTYSRMSVLALLGVMSFALFVPRGRRRRNAVGLSALLLGVMLPAVVTADGWIARGQQSLGDGGAGAGGAVDRFSSGRLTFAKQAGGLIADEPLFGVGPTTYVDVLGRVDPSLDLVFHVHVVPALIAAESGILAGVVFLLLLVNLALGAWRAGGVARALFCAPLAFLVLDHFLYSSTQGVVLLAIWIGYVSGLSNATPHHRQSAARTT